MAKKPFNHGKRSKGRFIMLRHDMQDSAAWRALSPVARSVWLEIMKKYNSKNNGDIGLSCRQAAELCGISKNTANRAFHQLMETGFIKIGAYSSFTMKYKKATRWIITHEPYNQLTATNEWKNWKPEIGAKI